MGYERSCLKLRVISCSAPTHWVYTRQDDGIEYTPPPPPSPSELCLPPCSFYMSTMRKLYLDGEGGLVGVTVYMERFPVSF